MIGFALRETAESIRTGKARTLMTVTTVSIALLIFSGFLLLSHNLHLGIDRFRATTRMDVILGESGDATRAATAIRALEGVAEARAYSRADALRYFREAHGEELSQGITEALGDVPFFAFVEVTLEGGVTDPEPVAGRIRSVESVEEVLYGRETVERLGRVAETVRLGTLAAGAVMALFVFLIVLNGIRSTIHARSDEIFVLRLVGASDGTIRLPFVLEGALSAITGSGLGLLFLSAVFQPARERVSFLALEFLPAEHATAIVLFAAALGALGGVIAVREALDQRV